MIEATSARLLGEINAREADLSNEFVPGYIPADDSDRSDDVRATRSLDPMNAVAPAKAYFVGVDAQGRRSFTRDSSLRLEDGALRTRDGTAILGVPAGATNATLNLLQADPVDVALGRVSAPHVEADGELVYTRNAVDPKTSEVRPERIVVGRIALARFPSGTQVYAADGMHVTAAAGVEPVIGLPNDGEFGKLVPQSTDQGGIDMHRGLAHLRDAYLAFSALQTLKEAHGKTDKVAMDLIK